MWRISMNINITKRKIFAALGISFIVVAFHSTDDEVQVQFADVTPKIERDDFKDSEAESQISSAPSLNTLSHFEPNHSEEIDEPYIDHKANGMPSRVNQFVSSIDAGDDRSPPIIRQEDISQTPQDILEDEEKYLQFQALERQKVMISYLKAAGPKMAFIRDKIAEGKQRGISQERIQEAQRKLEKMEQMVAELHQEYPNLKEMIAHSHQ